MTTQKSTPSQTEISNSLSTGSVLSNGFVQNQNHAPNGTQPLHPSLSNAAQEHIVRPDSAWPVTRATLLPQKFLCHFGSAAV